MNENIGRDTPRHEVSKQITIVFRDSALQGRVMDVIKEVHYNDGSKEILPIPEAVGLIEIAKSYLIASMVGRRKV